LGCFGILTNSATPIRQALERAKWSQAGRLQRGGQGGDGAKLPVDQPLNRLRGHPKIAGQQGEELDQTHRVQQLAEAGVGGFGVKVWLAKVPLNLLDPAQQVVGQFGTELVHIHQGCGSVREKKPSAMSQQ
jgi:hypothetical protein